MSEDILDGTFRRRRAQRATLGPEETARRLESAGRRSSGRLCRRSERRLVDAASDGVASFRRARLGRSCDDAGPFRTAGGAAIGRPTHLRSSVRRGKSKSDYHLESFQETWYNSCHVLFI